MRSSTGLSSLPAAVVVAVLALGAVTGLVRTSLRPEPSAGFSVDAWTATLADARFLDAIGFTLLLAAAVTILSIAVAVPAARWLRSRPVARSAFALPVIVPHLLVAVVAVLWLGPGGLADRLLDPIPVQVVRHPSGLGIVLVYLVKEVPFLVLIVLATWTTEVDELVEAAAIAGAGRLRQLWLVVVPAIRVPLTLGSVLVAAFVIGSFEVPLLTGPTSPPTLAVHALDVSRLAGAAGRAEAAVVLLVATVLSLAVAAVLLTFVRRARHG